MTTHVAVTWGKSNTTDRSFFRQLFLQWLPSNVCMVLASTTETTSIDELAKLPDKITEFAIPTSSISAVSQSQLSSKIEQLHSQSQTFKSPSNDFSHFNNKIPLILVHPAQPHNDLSQTSVDTIKNSVILL